MNALYLEVESENPIISSIDSKKFNATSVYKHQDKKIPLNELFQPIIRKREVNMNQLKSIHLNNSEVKLDKCINSVNSYTAKRPATSNIRSSITASSKCSTLSSSKTNFSKNNINMKKCTGNNIFASKINEVENEDLLFSISNKTSQKDLLFNDIVKFQNSLGKWNKNQLNITENTFCVKYKVLSEKIRSLIKDIEEIDDIINTILCLLVLEDLFFDKKDEFKLIFNKSLKYLGKLSINYQEIKQQIYK